jgi:hypothetical protein
MIFGEKMSCLSAKVLMKTTEGAFCSKTLIRLVSDSSSTARDPAFVSEGFPTNADNRAATELPTRFLHFLSVTFFGLFLLNPSSSLIPSVE